MTEPISAADREKAKELEPIADRLVIARWVSVSVEHRSFNSVEARLQSVQDAPSVASLFAAAARVVELEAALAQSESLHADAEEWGRGLAARATALLEARQSAVKVIRSGVPQDAFGRGENNRWEKDIFLDEFSAAINAGASNDRK